MTIQKCSAPPALLVYRRVKQNAQEFNLNSSNVELAPHARRMIRQPMSTVLLLREIDAGHRDAVGFHGLLVSPHALCL